MNKKESKFLIISTILLSFTNIVSANDIYKASDDNGNIYYTDKVPRGQKDISVISKKTGIAKSILELEDINKSKQGNIVSEINKEKNKEEEEEIRKDQNLINSYSNVEELEKIKSYELEQIKRAITTDENIISSLLERRKQLEISLREESNPDLQKDLNKTIENINNARKNKDKNVQMLNERNAKYENEKERLIRVLDLINKENNKLR